jgi:hypothetical protein
LGRKQDTVTAAGPIIHVEAMAHNRRSAALFSSLLLFTSH